MVCNSCKTSYNVLSRLGTGSNCAYGGEGGLIVDIWGLIQKKESPDFRFPEVGISALVWPCSMYMNNTVEFPTESRAANNDRIFTGKDI